MTPNKLEQIIANSELSDEELLQLIREIQNRNKITAQAVQPEPVPVPVPVPVQPVQPVQEESTALQFDELSKLLQTDAWPQAVEPSLICNPDSEEDKLDRAEGIIDLLIDEPIKGKKLLDFGCGEGHVVFKSISQEAVLAVGYDVVSHSKWEEFKNEKIIFTTDLETTKSNGPYDIILLYDVVDHAQDDVLSKAAELLAPGGKIYLRAHPFCSRHATHLYHKLNKAFVHLVFSDEELEKLGFPVEYNKKVKYPIHTYQDMIKTNKLKILSENILRQRVEPFFKQNKLIANRISNCINLKGFPEFQCEQQFLDYVLTKG